jgi:hypothetical protein
MLTSDLIGPTWSVKYQGNAKSTKCKFIKDQIIKTQVKSNIKQMQNRQNANLLKIKSSRLKSKESS